MSGRTLTPEQVDSVEHIRRARTTGTHYEVLRVDQSAPATEVRQKYDALARTWHPDKFHRLGDPDLRTQIEENFAAINEAYAVLKDENKRAAYDRELKRRGVVIPSEQPASTLQDTLGHVIGVRRSGGKLTVESVVSGASSSTTSHRPSTSGHEGAPRQIQLLKDQLAQQLARARNYYEAARQDAAAGHWVKAESNFYLATRYDQRNTEYQDAYQEARRRAATHRAAAHVAQGDNSASYGRFKEAITSYQKAAEYDPPDGTPWFKLGQMLLSAEDDHRGAVEAWRKAVIKAPNNVEYRTALAGLYERLGLKQNAMREARALVDLDPRNSGAIEMIKRLRG